MANLTSLGMTYTGNATTGTFKATSGTKTAPRAAWSSTPAPWRASPSPPPAPDRRFAFTGTNTLTAKDASGNVITNSNASANNVTITANAPLTGTVSGLDTPANVLNQAGDFTSGVANLTSLGMSYIGNTGTGTFTATGGQPAPRAAW